MKKSNKKSYYLSQAKKYGIRVITDNEMSLSVAADYKKICRN